MPLGIISQEDYLKEVPNTNKVVENTSARIELDKPLGRGDKKETPESVRAVIAQESLSGLSLQDVAKEFNVSPQSVSAYKNNATSLATYNKPNDSLKKSNNIFRDRIVRRAGRLSICALDSISVDDFKSASLRDKSAVAKEMALVVRDLSPDNNKNDDHGPTVQVVIHAPAMKSEADYIDAIVSPD